MGSLWNIPYSATCAISSRFTRTKEPTTSTRLSWENTSPACRRTSSEESPSQEKEISNRTNPASQIRNPEILNWRGIYFFCGGMFLERNNPFGDAEASFKFIGIERLRDKIVGSSFHAFEVVLLSDQRSDHDDVGVFR